MAEDAEFRVEIKDFRATDLTSRNRFRDKLRIVGEFDDQKFKSKKELIGGGGDITWKFSWNSDYRIFSWKALEEKTLRINLLRSKTEHYGHLSVDLYTLATGPSEHNLPILDFDNKVVGRLNFTVLLDQVTNIAVIFKQISVKNLEPASGHTECNPYLKYSYSRHWPDVVEGNMKANYSDTQYNTRDPQWTDLPEIRFEASLRELLQESIVMHITHNGKLHNTTLARCNLLFRTLVDNGKTFKDEDLISFRGPLKVGTAEIEGLLTFKFLPRFAQMKPINVTRKAIHTEKGIYDATTLLPGLPLPKVPIIKTDERPVDTQRIGSESPSTQRKRLTKEGSNSGTTSGNNLRKSIANKIENQEKGKESPKDDNASKSSSKPVEVAKPAATVDDLISFTPPTLRRQRSLSHGGESSAKPLNFGQSAANPFLSSSGNIFPGSQNNNVPLYTGPGQPSGVMFPAQPFSTPAMSLQPAAQFGFYAQQQPFNANPQTGFAQQPQPAFNPFANAQPAPTFNPFATGAPQGQPTFNPFAQK